MPARSVGLGAMFGWIVAVLLLVYPLMFAGSYFFWKSALGGEGDAVALPADAMLSA